MNHERLLKRIDINRLDLLTSLSLFILMFLVYVKTLAPGVYGFDSAELATGVYTQGIIHPTGYPLYLLIGKLFTLFPFRDIAYRLNLMSAFFGALTVVFLYHLISQLMEHRWIVGLSAMIFGLSNYFWQMSIVAEVYTLHTAFFAVNLGLVLYWRKTGKDKALFIFALLFGLSLTNHTSGILFVPGFAWLIVSNPGWKWKNWKLILSMFATFLIGLMVYLYLPLRAQVNPPLNYVSAYYDIDLTTPAGLLWMISGQAYRFFSFGYSLVELPGEIARFAALLWRNFLGGGVILGIIGLVHLFKIKRHIAVGLLLLFLATVTFYVNYRVMDKDTMFLAVYLVWAIFLAEGLVIVEKWMREKLAIYLSNQFRYISIAIMVFLPGLILNAQWVDMSKADAYSRYGQAILSDVEPGAMIIAPWSQAVVLEYFQIVEGYRPDIKIINSSRMNVANYYELWSQNVVRDRIFDFITEQNLALIEEHIQSQSVYSIDYDAALATQYEYLPDGSYFRLAVKK